MERRRFISEQAGQTQAGPNYEQKEPLEKEETSLGH